MTLRDEQDPRFGTPPGTHDSVQKANTGQAKMLCHRAITPSPSTVDYIGLELVDLDPRRLLVRLLGQRR
jgi:hypothetical protein